MPIFFVFLRRMQSEDAALIEALDEPYAACVRRTKRFVLGVF